MPEPAQHSTPEMRLAANNEIATFEDLDGLSEARLLEVMQECPVEPPDPDVCVPCRAFALVAEARKQAADEALHKLENPVEVPETPDSADSGEPEITESTPLSEPVAAQLATLDVGEELIPADVRARFAQQVRDLNLTVKELLEGPPIPPPGVTIEELAALVVGANNWVAHMDSQISMGMEPTIDLRGRIERIRSVVERIQKR